jgi:hypothetical protein
MPTIPDLSLFISTEFSQTCDTLGDDPIFVYQNTGNRRQPRFISLSLQQLGDVAYAAGRLWLLVCVNLAGQGKGRDGEKSG